MNLDVLEAIYGPEIKNIDFLKQVIKKDSNHLLSELECYRIFDDEETKIIDDIENVLRKVSRIIIEDFSQEHFKMPIHMTIATQSQEKIKAKFLLAAKKLHLDSGWQVLIDSELDEIADKLNKRFTFDEASLIHLIEASKASNIQLEEDVKRISSNNKRQILRQRDDGQYYLSDVTEKKGVDTYTTGKSIPTIDIPGENHRIITKTTVDEKRNIELSSYPGAKYLIGTTSNDEIMKQVMKNLFANLELCADTYKFFYTKNPNDPLEKSVSVLNTAVFADDSTFDFYYNINRWNLPHLLGIPKGEMLSEATKNYFAQVRNGTVYYPIDEHSSAFEILQVLLENKDRIIADRGLVEDNGKVYQLFPWEKIILKTSSCIRGDFFKTCFCLVQLNYGLNAPNEEFVSISPTKYNEGIASHFDAKKVLRDLINNQKQRKDFVFRTFIANYDRYNKFLGYIPQSIDTGKSESIVTNNGERIATLNRYRNALQGSEGYVVESIENANMKKIFSPLEQSITQVSVSSNLGVNLQVSEETINFEQKLCEKIDGVLDKELYQILTQSSSKKR